MRLAHVILLVGAAALTYTARPTGRLGLDERDEHPLGDRPAAATLEPIDAGPVPHVSDVDAAPEAAVELDAGADRDLWLAAPAAPWRP